MLKMYILIALRKLAKEKIYVFINIFSLALGIASFVVLSLYLRSELSYDQHNSKHESIYRLVSNFSNGEFAVTSEGLGPLLIQDYPQLGEFTRFRNASQNTLSYEDNRQSWDNMYLVDENLFDVFDHEIIYGDPETALDDPYSIAISESFAFSYFGDRDPVGEVLVSDSFSYRVTLVFADLPENTHLKYNAVYPYSILEVFLPNYQDDFIRRLWGVSIYTYLHVAPEFDPSTFPDISASFYDQYMAERGESLNSSFSAEIQPLASIHFGEPIAADLPAGNIFYIYGFAAVAIFILLVACINYMNLATARATKRSKEVGMRKVLGATRSQLMGQFIGESMVFTMVAMVIGLFVAAFALAFTPIGSLMGKEELLISLLQPSVLFGVLLLAIGVGLLSGLYPAFYLSSISPKAALTKVAASGRSRFSIRQLLVLIQMSISIGVISSTLLMSAQMRYIANKPLGFDKENKVLVQIQGADAIETIPTMEIELLAQPGILDVVNTRAIPGTGNAVNLMQVENNEGVMEPTGVDRIMVGLDYITGMDIEVIEGRSFSEDIATDSTNSMMVNESMVAKMGWDEPIGKRIGNPDDPMLVVGVTRDFHYAPLHNEISALLIHPFEMNFDNTSAMARPLQRTTIAITIAGDNVGATLEAIDRTIKEFAPGNIFDPVFLDEQLDRLYVSERNLMNLTELFAVVCILISAVGLFGLAAFTTQQRFKEIGVRKVLGASSLQIIFLLTKQLIFLVALAALPSCIISYYALTSWLEKFAYRTDIDITPFLIATVAVTLVTFVTVALQSLKTSQSNPVNALRYE